MFRLCNLIATLLFWLAGGFLAKGAYLSVSTGLSVYLGAISFVCFCMGLLCAVQTVINKDLLK